MRLGVIGGGLIKVGGREGRPGGPGGAPGSPLASPRIPLALNLLCPAVAPTTLPALHIGYFTPSNLLHKPNLKVLLLAGIKMMYHHYSSSKVRLSRLQLLQQLLTPTFQREEITRLQTALHGDDYQLGNNRNEQM